MMKKLFLALFAGALMLAPGCSSDDGGVNDPENPQPPKTDPEVIDWTPVCLNEVPSVDISNANDFSIGLFKKIFNSKKKNVSISPVSIYCTLAMFANGDEGECRDEVLAMMGFSKGPEGLHDLNLYCNALISEVPSEGAKSNCTFTNSLWYNPEITINPLYAALLKTIYGAQIFNIDPAAEQGRVAMNNFVDENTNGMIKDFLKEPLNVNLALMNTSYFKGEWKYTFNEQHTYKKYFINLDGSQTQTDFMSMANTQLEFGETEGLRGVTLPYHGDRYTMTFVQPAEDSDFESMLADLDYGKISRLRSSFQKNELLLSVPKFTDEFNAELIDYLEEMGLVKCRVFGFRNITVPSTDQVLTVFKHGVKIIVDEAGTEAAAVTVGGTNECSSKYLNFNSPFLYILQDTVSKTILFMGAVTGF